MKIFQKACLVMLLVALPLLWQCGPESECKSDSDCASGQTCADGKCKAESKEKAKDGSPPESKTENPPTEQPPEKTPPKQCQKDSDCQPGEKCNPNTKQCAVPCEFDVQCPKDMACDKKNGGCIKAQPCKANSDCPDTKDSDGKPLWVCNECRGHCSHALKTNRCNEDYNCADISKEWCDKCIHHCRPRKKDCDPCAKDEECGDKGECLPSKNSPNQKFCLVGCKKGEHCKPGFSCTESKISGAKSTHHCLPASGDCGKPWGCDKDSDCASKGKICDTKRKVCILGCQDDATCSTDTQGPCQSKSDCKHPLAECNNGTCEVKQKCCRSRCGPPCVSNGDCEANEKCKDGCCYVEGECNKDNPCPPKNYCDPTTRLCKPGCLVPNDCGLPDPKRNRCLFKCENNKCVEDCRCKNPNLDCAKAVRFCPSLEEQKKDPLAPCRKPVGPLCKPCKGNQDCGCQKGDDCKYICTKKECKQDSDCAGMPNSATKCYNGRCATKSVCKVNSDCSGSEKCENGYCAENCNNICLKLENGNRCFTGCDPLGDGRECPSRMSCIELLPQEASGKKCKGSSKQCTKDADCAAPQARCGEDGYCTSCVKGKVCRNLNPENPLDLICIPRPPTICGSLGGDICAEGEKP